MSGHQLPSSFVSAVLASKMAAATQQGERGGSPRRSSRSISQSVHSAAASDIKSPTGSSKDKKASGGRRVLSHDAKDSPLADHGRRVLSHVAKVRTERA